MGYKMRKSGDLDHLEPQSIVRNRLLVQNCGLSCLSRKKNWWCFSLSKNGWNNSLGRKNECLEFAGYSSDPEQSGFEPLKMGEWPAKMLFCSQVNWPTKRIKRKCVPASNGDIPCRTSGSSNSSTHYNLPTSGQVGFLGSKHNRPHFNSFWQLAQPASWSSWSLCRLLSWGTLRYSNMVYHPPQQKNTHTHPL